jgi:cell wall-associated NlpC family hydrolase
MTASREVEALGEQLTRATGEVTQATTEAEQAEQRLSDAELALQDLTVKATSEASEAYKAGTELGLFDSYADELHQLSRIAPGMGPKAGSEAAARELLKAEAAVRYANENLLARTSLLRDREKNRDTLQATYTNREANLNGILTRNAVALRAADAERERYEQSLGGGNLSEISIDGKMADPRALKAVEFALRQRGKPYVYGAEGPDTYDCSGLVQTAYRPYYALPRVASDQYLATSAKAIKATRSTRGDLLVPGDLLFFSPISSWTGVHHVAIYIGSGQMVHAPKPGDVVRIAPVWWSELFAVTRIFNAVNAPSPTPGQPTTQPPVSPSRSPDPSPSTPVPTGPPPTPSVSPTPTRSPEPPESTAPSQPPASGSASDTPAVSPSANP